MKKLLRLILAILLLVSTGNYVWAQNSNQKDRDLPVMTRNMDAGSDFGYILAAAMNPELDTRPTFSARSRRLSWKCI